MSSTPHYALPTHSSRMRIRSENEMTIRGKMNHWLGSKAQGNGQHRDIENGSENLDEGLENLALSEMSAGDDTFNTTQAVNATLAVETIQDINTPMSDDADDEASYTSTEMLELFESTQPAILAKARVQVEDANTMIAEKENRGSFLHTSCPQFFFSILTERHRTTGITAQDYMYLLEHYTALWRQHRAAQNYPANCHRQPLATSQRGPLQPSVLQPLDGPSQIHTGFCQ